MIEVHGNAKRQARLVFLVLCLSPIWSYGTCQASEADVGSVIKGTLIIALQNENGFVLMTDSMQTRVNPDGTLEPLPTAPSKKLFKLGEHTVCMVAGFASTTLPTDPQFSVSAAGIIEEYQNELMRRSRSPSLSEALWTLSFLFRNYLGGTATLKQFMHLPQKIDSYRFSLVVAGYDPDGRPRLGTLTLVPDSSRGTMVSFEASVQEVKLGNSLTYTIGGQFEKAVEIMRNPRQFEGDPAVKRYAEALDRGAASSLSLGEMKGLAEALMQYTEKESMTVGGERQVATIVRDGPLDVEQRRFAPHPLRIRPFTIVASSLFQGGGLSINSTGLFIGNRFENAKPLTLDGHFFFGNVFRSSHLLYDGGTTHFDQSNDIGDSVLVFGKHSDQNPRSVRKLKEGFSWGRVVVEPK